MSVTQAQAWAIFKADKLGQPEGEAAQVTMTDEEMAAYLAISQEFEMKLAQIGIEANNEAAALTDNHPAVEALEGKRLIDFTAKEYIDIVALFEGSKYERLHLTALFRIPNNELLLELVKP